MVITWFQSTPMEVADFLEKNNDLLLNGRIIVISVLVYVISMLIQHWLNVRLKKKDLGFDRKMKIADLCIKEEIELFKKLDKLRYFQSGEKHNMLDEIESVNNYLNANRILVDREVIDIAREILDYFTKVCVDFSTRDVKKEGNLFDKYKEKFYE